ncbi:MAG TPA: AraC family transcriptional regulator [Chryseolinea sp.]|nr:AraC family transcriptional regulator [Chryseolinea sp.]
MTTDIIELHNFIVLIEESRAPKTFTQKCAIDTDVVGFAFYGSGNVELEIKHNDQTKYVTNTTGMAISFYGNHKVEFSHKIAPDKPLQSISVFAKIKHLHTLPESEQQIFEEQLPQLLHPQENFVKGPSFYMNLDMQHAVQKVFSTRYSGNTRLLFLKSQVNELLAHFFARLLVGQESDVLDSDKLFQAKEIIANNIAKPPSLTELSKLIGLNNNKLKKNFKELFGLPVFKYLQEERLKKAYELLCHNELSVQETAWYVGYESLSSFSNAFQKKFGMRPNELKQQFLSNKS